VILYSIIPPEIIFNNNSNEMITDVKEIDYMGIKVQVRANSENEYVITRLLSTSPRDYLNPKLQPGTIIKTVSQDNN